jgi:hemerythrin superfamily protein
MNAIDLLDTQHRDVDSMFAMLETGDRNQRVFDDFADLLAIHATIEEQHFYPAVKARRTEDILEHSLQEHVDIKRHLALCMATALDSEKFPTRLRALKRTVQEHVQEERTNLFPKVRRIMSDDVLEAIGQEMTSTMAQLQQGRPRFDVPLQTLAPMPLTELPTHGNIGSRVWPYVSRFVNLPLQMLGVAKRLGSAATGVVRGVQRGMSRKRPARG